MTDSTLHYMVHFEEPVVADEVQVYRIALMDTIDWPEGGGKSIGAVSENVKAFGVVPYALICAAMTDDGWAWMHLSADTKRYAGELLIDAAQAEQYAPGTWVWLTREDVR